MNKMDDLRRMREAAHDEAMARKSKGTTPAAAAPKPPVRRRAAVTPSADPAATEGTCGHRSMNGRTCTREQGHAAKSHRYS